MSQKVIEREPVVNMDFFQRAKRAGRTLKVQNDFFPSQLRGVVSVRVGDFSQDNKVQLHLVPFSKRESPVLVPFGEIIVQSQG